MLPSIIDRIVNTELKNAESWRGIAEFVRKKR